MIFYFSGTGNSEFIAKKTAELTNDTALSIVDLNPKECNLDNEDRIGLVFPIYAWNAPTIFADFVSKLSIKRTTYTYAICTCGSDCGTAIDHLDKIAKIHAAISLSMPNNYIISSDIDTSEVAHQKVSSAIEQLENFCLHINKKESEFKLNRGSFPKIKGSLISFAFQKFATNDKLFFAEDSCNSCAMCERDCPLHNISLKDGRPSWNGNCIQCLACLNKCPVSAIQYTNVTKKRGRYQFSENILKNN